MNSSKGNILNAEPVAPAMEATTLVELLRLLSKKFVSGINYVLSLVLLRLILYESYFKKFISGKEILVDRVLADLY